MKKILLLPGWMINLRMYNKYSDLEIQIGRLSDHLEGTRIIGLSLGALEALRVWDNTGKLVLVNPLLPKRSILRWFANWIRYISAEGLFLERQQFTNNPVRYVREVMRCVKLLKINFLEIIDRLDVKNLIVIRGKNDNFFCDEEAVTFLKSKNIKILEIENAGHNWSEEIEEVAMQAIE